MSSKRVSKKSSRYADYFEPEEIDCKRKRKDDGDDDEFDDDMVPVPEDLADVLKKKTTKQKPKGKGVQREKDRNQKISKAEKKCAVQRAAIKAQKMQAEAMFASYKIKASPMMS